MPRKKASSADTTPLAQYTHQDKQRANNPPVGLVTPDTDQEGAQKTYAYDPHLDPQLHWAGKAEHTSFAIPTVSLHVHERIDPRTIIEAVRKPKDTAPQAEQLSLFATKQENPPLREAVEFYKHRHNWTNRLLAGDSLLVMNSLLEKEGLAGHVQMVYLDPPYGIRYGSNFQPFVNKRDVKDGKDEDLTQEPETIRAFRDTWELGIHSYLTYLRDRLLLARELLHESGSVFVQISDENVHLVRNLMDEVFGAKNFCAQITYQKTGGFSADRLQRNFDYIVWYAKDAAKVKFHKLFEIRELSSRDTQFFDSVELSDGTRRELTAAEKNDLKLIPSVSRLFARNPLNSDGYVESLHYEFEFGNQKFKPPINRHWTTTKAGMETLKLKKRLCLKGNTLRFVRYLDDYPASVVGINWTDTGTGGFVGDQKIYVVQTDSRALQRCLLMTTDPGDLVFDPTCGSGTTAYVAEQWGRRWITCDTSRVAVTLARQRLMTALFDYYQLAQPEEGVGSGFRYKIVPHVTLKSIANNEPPAQETLYDQPLLDSSKLRVTGPFTVEAVPAPTVQPLDEVAGNESEAEASAPDADASIARSGETLRQAEWRDELARTGIRNRGGDKLAFARVELLSGTRWLHADAEVTNGQEAVRAVLSFGPQHAPLEQRQVEWALEEARKLFPKPKMLIFAAFQFDPEAAKDIEETNWPGVTLLKAQMNADLLTDDLKKKRASNESFWLIGQPDVVVKRIAPLGSDEATHQVEVLGFDYYDTRKGEIVSGGTGQIALWMLDTDYDGRSLLPRQVFFPLAGEKDGWARLAKNLKAEIDEELIEAYRGTKSLPFKPGARGRIAVKIVDDRGIESFRVMDV